MRAPFIESRNLVFFTLFIFCSCKNSDTGHFDPWAFCSTNPQPISYCGDFEDSTCSVAINIDSCIVYQAYILNDSSYNGSKCLYAVSCDSAAYFPAAEILLGQICNDNYKIKFHYKINSSGDSAELEIKGLIESGYFSVANYSVPSTEFNIWKVDSIVTGLPATVDHKVNLNFLVTGKEFYLDDVSIEIIQ